MTKSTAVRPLVVRFGSMGDMVISLALIQALHKRFGAPVDVISSGSWTRPLLESQPGRRQSLPHSLAQDAVRVQPGTMATRADAA